MNHESGSSCGTRPGVNGIVTRNGGLMIEPLSSDGSLPLVVTPVEGRTLDGYLAAARHYAEAFLPASGGLLFRGLPIGSVADFESFVGGFTSSLVSYEFGSTPGRVCSDRSTLRPNTRRINISRFTTSRPTRGNGR